jgi:hypothetical protein
VLEEDAERRLRITAVILAALALVFWGQPTGKTILVLAGLLLVVLALIEFLSQPPHPPSSPPQPRPEPDSGGASTPSACVKALPCWLNGCCAGCAEPARPMSPSRMQCVAARIVG